MRRWLVRSLRAPGVVLSFLGAFYVLGLMRTSEFGPDARVYSWGLLVLLPFLVIALLAMAGLPPRKQLLGALAWVLVTVAAAECFARAQEVVFRARYASLPPSAETVVEDRWWPFTGNVLLYDPARGWWMGND